MTPYLSPSDLAAMLDVPEQTVYGWNSKRTGPRFAKVGRHVRYRSEDVNAWFEAHLSPVAS